MMTSSEQSDSGSPLVGRTDRSIWRVVGGAMQEDGLHGIDGFDVWRGDERADDSFFQDREDAQEMADRLNEEDGHDG